MWLSNRCLGILKSLKILKFSKFFKIFPKLPGSFQNFQETEYMLNSLMSDEHVYFFMSISPKMTELQRFTCRKQALFTSFLQFSIIFDFYFLSDFDNSKSVVGLFVVLYAKIWPKNMYFNVYNPKFLVLPLWPRDLRWPWPEIPQDGTSKCSRHYSCRFVIAGFNVIDVELDFTQIDVD